MEHQTTPAGGTRPRWTTLLFCAAPLAALIAIFVFRIPVGQVLLWGLVLLCPLSHLLFGHGGHSHAHASGSQVDSIVRQDGSRGTNRAGSCH